VIYDWVGSLSPEEKRSTKWDMRKIMLERVEAHHRFWKYSEAEYRWIYNLEGQNK
jgi:hypothetical protein